MNIVVVGAKNRSEMDDKPVVLQLIEDLKESYPALIIGTAFCGRGVGKIIRTKCQPPVVGGKPYVNWIEFTVKLYLHDVAKSKAVEASKSLNDSMITWGDMFHLFLDSDPRSQVADLLISVKAAGRPCTIYYADGTIHVEGNTPPTSGVEASPNAVR